MGSGARGEAGALLAGLNPEQRQAVTATDAALLVIAGPGSGKTRVVAHRIAHAVGERGIESSRVVAVTFTTKAAQEMRDRVGVLLSATGDVRIGTFHWLCHAILRRQAHHVGRRRDFRLLTPRESASLLRACAKSISADGAGSREWTAAVSAVKNGMSLEGVGQSNGLDLDMLAAVIRAYDIQLDRLRALDLDGLLAACARLLREHPDVRARCSDAISELLVDEFQDTNPVQQELVRLLRPAGGSIVAVGDEDQAIYGWRQAGSGSVRQFLTSFPEGRTIILRTTYRCSRHILRAATALIQHNADRVEKMLTTSRPAGQRPICCGAGDERDEAEWIAGQIEELTRAGRAAVDEVAVLYRTNIQARAIEEALVRRDLPYVVRSGPRFFELPEIQLLVAVLRVMLDSADDEAVRVLLERLPGIGPRRRDEILRVAGEANLALLDTLVLENISVPAPVRARLRELHSALRDVERQRTEMPPQAVAAAIGFTRSFVGEPESAPLDDPLVEVQSLVEELNPRDVTLTGLIDRMTLTPPTVSGEGVALLTLHAAKGLEFDAVFLAGLEEGLLPHRRSTESPESLEEERRLCYVGMTRARHLLFLSYAHMRMLGGHGQLSGPSRFLAEMGAGNVTFRSSHSRRGLPRLLQVRAGERVTHPRWSAGIVLRVEGQGRETVVTVDFGSWGIRRLQLCHAPLEHLPREDERVATG